MTVMISPTQSILRGGRGKPIKGSPETVGSVGSSMVSGSSSRWRRRGASRERYSRASRLEEPARNPLLAQEDSASASMYDVGNVGSVSQDSAFDDPAKSAVDGKRWSGLTSMRRDSREDTEATAGSNLTVKTDLNGEKGSRQNISPTEHSRHPFRPVSDAQNMSASGARSTGRTDDMASPIQSSGSLASRSGRHSPFEGGVSRPIKKSTESKSSEARKSERSPVRNSFQSSRSDVGERRQISSSLRDKAIKSLQIRKAASFGVDNDDENQGEPEAKLNADFSVSSWDKLMDEVDQSTQSPHTTKSTRGGAAESRRRRNGRHTGGASSVVSSSSSYSNAARKWKSSVASRSYSRMTVDDDGNSADKDSPLSTKRSASMEEAVSTTRGDVVKVNAKTTAGSNASTAFRRKAVQDVDMEGRDEGGDADVRPAGRTRLASSESSAMSPNSSIDTHSARKAKSSGKVARLASFFSSRSTAKGSTNTAGTSLSSTSTGHDGHSVHSGSRDRATNKGTPPPKQREGDGEEFQGLTSERSKGSDHSQAYSTPRSVTPSSPSRMSNVSGTSSGYVGWPGTQDRTGGTVAIQPSYSGSDEGTFRGISASEGGMSGYAAEPKLKNPDVSTSADRANGRELEGVSDTFQAEPTAASRRGRTEGRGVLRGVPASANNRYVNGDLVLPANEAVDGVRNERGPSTEFDDSSDSEDEIKNPADFHLAAVVADAAAAASPMVASMASSGSSSHAAASTTSREGYVTLRHLTKTDNGNSPNSASTTASSDSTSARNSSIRSTQSKDGSRRRGRGAAVLRGARLTAQIHGSGTTQNKGLSPSSSSLDLRSPAPYESGERSSSGRRTRFDLGDKQNNSARTRFDLGDQHPNSAESIVDSEGGITIRNLFPPGRKGASTGASTPRSGTRTPQSGRTSASSGFSDPWDIDNSSPVPSSAGDSDPFIDHGVQTDDLPFRERPRTLVSMERKMAPVIDTSGSEMRMKSSGKKINQRQSPSADSVSPLSTGSSMYFGHRKRPSPSPIRKSSKHGPPTEEALSLKNSQNPSLQLGNASNVRGYRGFIDKTKDVPNLMDSVDSESQSTTSTQANSAGKEQPPPPPPGETSRKVVSSSSPTATEGEGDATADAESDVFSGISSVAPISPYLRPNFIQNGKDRVTPPSASPARPQRLRGLRQSPPETDSIQKGVRVVKVGKFSTVQAPPDAFARRSTSTEFDKNLADTDTDQFASDRAPRSTLNGAGRKRVEAIVPGELDSKNRENAPPRNHDSHGRSKHQLANSKLSQVAMDDDSVFSAESGVDEVPDLSHYAVEPEQVKKLVKKFRKMCKYCEENEVDNTASDSKKAFALFEMRSRIMETDIERGLERMGGTVTVDDLVTTAYHRCAHRVRDAVIVSKAWRDGASPKDVVTASSLTRRAFGTYFIRRAIRRRRGRVVYRREEVTWIDDTDFSLFRCASLGPRTMRGSEMFTIGDCQSILLKLTNERCMQLRNELDEATARQLQAEDLMREEAESGNDMSCTSDGDMTQAEMTYLSSMEDVKTIAKKLVVAERSFNLVRERIEKLVTKYETLLVKMEDGSGASSIGTESDESDYDSDYDSEEEDNEKEILARRAQRAELRAEVAAREAKLAKEEARKIQASKQKELDELQRRLAELETKSSNPESDIDSRSRGELDSQRSGSSKIRKSQADTRTILQGGARSMVQEDTSKNAAKERIKAKFRSRRAEKKHGGVPISRSGSDSGSSIFTGITTTSSLLDAAKIKTVMKNRHDGYEEGGNNRNRTAGEEMYQHLDFYARSLKAVDKKKTGQ